jgi:UDP-glucose 4-epimerase
LKIVVVGGAGFIGSHFSKEIIKKFPSAVICIFDNFTSGTRSHIKGLLEDHRIQLVEGDLKDLDSITNVLVGTELVANFAANPDIAKASTQPDIDFWEGTYLMQNLLEGMRVNEVRKIVYSSGSGVYGDVPGVEFDENFSPLEPVSTYGASKLACEALIHAYSHMFDFQARIFRFANVVGPEQTHGVGYDFLNKLKADQTRLKILGDGTQTKSYIFIEDVLTAMMIGVSDLVSNSKPQVDVYNVATDDYISVETIAELACSTLGLNVDSVNFEYTGGDRGWKGDVPSVRFNTEKIKSRGWSAVRNSSEAIRESLSSMSN